jgi:hypothetical protein
MRNTKKIIGSLMFLIPALFLYIWLFSVMGWYFLFLQLFAAAVVAYVFVALVFIDGD